MRRTTKQCMLVIIGFFSKTNHCYCFCISLYLFILLQTNKKCITIFGEDNIWYNFAKYKQNCFTHKNLSNGIFSVSSSVSKSTNAGTVLSFISKIFAVAVLSYISKFLSTTLFLREEGEGK